MARSKKQITPVEGTPDFSISLSKKDMTIFVSKVGDKLNVNSTPLSEAKNILDLVVYRDLLTSVIDEYFEHTVTDMLADTSKECVNPEEDLKPCYCHQ